MCRVRLASRAGRWDQPSAPTRALWDPESLSTPWVVVSSRQETSHLKPSWVMGQAAEISSDFFFFILLDKASHNYLNLAFLLSRALSLQSLLLRVVPRRSDTKHLKSSPPSSHLFSLKRSVRARWRCSRNPLNPAACGWKKSALQENAESGL